MSPRRGQRLHGVHTVLAALRSGRRSLHRLWLAESRQQQGRVPELLELARQRGLEPQRVDRSELDRLAQGGVHQGVVLEAGPLPELELEELLSACGSRALLLVLDQVQDPRNLGAVLRSAAAAGAQGVVTQARRQAPLGAGALKVAEGAAEYVPLVAVVNLSRALRQLAEAGIWTVGLDPAASTPWHSAHLSDSVALVLGSEGRGLRRLVRESCQQSVSLPMAPGVESLNVAATAAVMLFETLRQRSRVGAAGGVD